MSVFKTIFAKTGFWLTSLPITDSSFNIHGNTSVWQKYSVFINSSMTSFINKQPIIFCSINEGLMHKCKELHLICFKFCKDKDCYIVVNMTSYH